MLPSCNQTSLQGLLNLQLQRQISENCESFLLSRPPLFWQACHTAIEHCDRKFKCNRGARVLGELW